MGTYKDWTGYKYNTFTVVCEDKEYTKLCEERIKAGLIKRYNKKWICYCECGNIVGIFAT